MTNSRLSEIRSSYGWALQFEGEGVKDRVIADLINYRSAHHIGGRFRLRGNAKIQIE